MYHCPSETLGCFTTAGDWTKRLRSAFSPLYPCHEQQYFYSCAMGLSNMNIDRHRLDRSEWGGFLPTEPVFELEDWPGQHLTPRLNPHLIPELISLLNCPLIHKLIRLLIHKL